MGESRSPESTSSASEGHASITVWVEGHPAPMPRPKWQGRGGMVYSARASRWISAIDGAVLHAVSKGGLDCFAGPLGLTVRLYMPAPSKPKGEPSRAPKGNQPQWDTRRPDLDNLLKLICDRLEHCGLITDDSQIVRISASKVVCPPGYTTGADVTLEAIVGYPNPL